MILVESVEEMREFSDNAREEGKTIGFVPTMGYLHEGHLSLVRAAKKECDAVIVSIFVNPLQFGPNEDFNEYPRNLKHDMALLEKENVDAVFHPSANEMYPTPQLVWVNADKLADRLCGASRPIHFRGVATVVSKLFNIVKPHKAYFGQKDYQQCMVVERIAKDLNFAIDIVTCGIVREKDGLAMSSRNKHLSREERKAATIIYKSLNKAKELIGKGEEDSKKICNEIKNTINSENLARIDYIEIVDADTLEPKKKVNGKALIALAVYIGKTRLIDNLLIKK